MSLMPMEDATLEHGDMEDVTLEDQKGRPVCFSLRLTDYIHLSLKILSWIFLYESYCLKISKELQAL
jgi:hypothetical protein